MTTPKTPVVELRRQGTERSQPMAKTSWKMFVVALSTSASLACACSNRGPVASAPATATTAGQKEQAPAPDSVVAKIGDAKVTMAELDEHVAAQLRELTDQAYEVRRQGLDQMVNQRLVQAAAFKKGLTEDKWLQEEVDKKVVAPSDAEVKKFFEQNSAQLPPGAKLADFKERIGQFLRRQGQSEQAKAVFAELRKDAGVEVLLNPPPKPRIQVEAKGPSTGPADAKVVMVEFSDFECPFCSRAKNVVDEVMKKYDGKVRLVFRQFPLSFHSHAKKAAEASLCADAQGKFWAYHDALFADQKHLEAKELKEAAKKLGLDEAAFASCLDGGSKGAIIDEDLAAAQKAGVTGTPAFFINGVLLSGAQPLEEFERVIDAELKG